MKISNEFAASSAKDGKDLLKLINRHLDAVEFRL